MISAKAVADSSSNYLILGVIASTENQQGVALIKDTKSGKTFAQKEGQALDNKTKLSKVFRKHVEVVIGESKYLIKVGDFTADAISSGASSSSSMSIAQGIEKTEGTVKVSAALKDHLVNEKLSTVLMQAAAVPFYQDGSLSGFTLWDIEKDSIYEKVGFQDGDTVTTINEQKINDVGSTIKLLNSLKNETNANVTYLRNGVETTVKIVVQ